MLEVFGATLTEGIAYPMHLSGSAILGLRTLVKEMEFQPLRAVGASIIPLLVTFVYPSFTGGASALSSESFG